MKYATWLMLCFSEINYNVREVLKLPPAPALEILRGQLEIRSVKYQLGNQSVFVIRIEQRQTHCTHMH